MKSFIASLLILVSGTTCFAGSLPAGSPKYKAAVLLVDFPNSVAPTSAARPFSVKVGDIDSMLNSRYYFRDTIPPTNHINTNNKLYGSAWNYWNEVSGGKVDVEYKVLNPVTLQGAYTWLRWSNSDPYNQFFYGDGTISGPKRALMMALANGWLAGYTSVEQFQDSIQGLILLSTHADPQAGGRSYTGVYDLRNGQYDWMTMMHGFNNVNLTNFTYIGTWVHENGHLFFGMHDEYAQASPTTLGRYCLMADGFTDGGNACPAPPNIFYRMEQGWSVPVILTNRFADSMAYDMASQQSSRLHPRNQGIYGPMNFQQYGSMFQQEYRDSLTYWAGEWVGSTWWDLFRVSSTNPISNKELFVWKSIPGNDNILSPTIYTFTSGGSQRISHIDGTFAIRGAHRVGERLIIDTTTAGTIIKTLSPSSVTSTSAQLRMWIIPPLISTTLRFAFGTSPTALTETLAVDNSPKSDWDYGFTTKSGLSCNSTYYFRAIGDNVTGQYLGAVIQFKTAGASTIFNGPITSKTSTSFTASASVNPFCDSTQVWLLVGTSSGHYPDTFYVGKFGQCSLTGVSGSATGRQPSTLYYYTFRSKNTVCGFSQDANQLTVTTDAAGAISPDLVSLSADNITYNSARMRATLNTHNFQAISFFEYGRTTSYGLTATSAQSPVISNSAMNVDALAVNLLPGVLYHYRPGATVGSTTTYGGDITFTTPSTLPRMWQIKTTNVTSSTIAMEAKANAGGVETTTWFKYREISSTTYTTVSTSQDLIYGYSDTTVTRLLTGLSANSQYWVGGVAFNENGWGYSDSILINTGGAALAPVAVTGTWAIESSYLTLHGLVSAGAVSTVVRFDFKKVSDGTYSQFLYAVQSPITGNNISVSAAFPPQYLTPGETYNYRVRAVNINGTGIGNDSTFNVADTTQRVMLIR